jgi:hypothetical protein
LRTAPILLLDHWLLTYSCEVYCLARAHACGIESSRAPVEHSRSHSRTCQFNSARTSGSCNSAAFPPATCYDAIRAGLPPPPVLLCASNPCRVASALTALPLCSSSFRIRRAITADSCAPGSPSLHAAAPLARVHLYREPRACYSAATSVLFCSRAATPRAPLQHRLAHVLLTRLRDASRAPAHAPGCPCICACAPDSPLSSLSFHPSKKDHSLQQNYLALPPIVPPD